MSDQSSQDQLFGRYPAPQFLTETRFTDFDLPAEVLAGLADAGFDRCTPIQAQTLPLALAGQDVAGQAQTGTGKTAAFLVAVLTKLLRLPERDPHFPSALIVAPTRELALQIYADAQVIGGPAGLSLAQVVGGIDYVRQAEVLRQGADIVICTPGRIIDYLKQGVFKTSAIKALVIDEADRLFDLGFTKDMRYILRRLPHYEKRQSMLFSATLSHRVLELTYEYMNLPKVIRVAAESLTVEGVEQSLFHVGRKEKLNLLLGLLEREDWSRMLIFVNTKAGVDWLAQKLIGNGYAAEGISGDLPQRRRLKLVSQFKEDKLNILVATDVASRGLHIEAISHVINYDLPQDPENYIHRIGRTARAGATGRAITMACEDYVVHLEPLEKLLGYKIPVVWPEDDWFRPDQAGRVFSRRDRWADERAAEVAAEPKPQRRRQRRRQEEPAEPAPAETQPLLSEAAPESSDVPGSTEAFSPSAPAEAETEPAGPPPGPEGEPAAGVSRSKRRRRRRRKKKTGPGGEAGPALVEMDMAASGPPEEPAPAGPPEAGQAAAPVSPETVAETPRPKRRRRRRKKPSSGEAAPVELEPSFQAEPGVETETEEEAATDEDWSEPEAEAAAEAGRPTPPSVPLSTGKVGIFGLVQPSFVEGPGAGSSWGQKRRRRR